MRRATSKLQYLLIALLFLFWNYTSFAQNENQVSLQLIIEAIENEHDVRISYASNTIKNISLIPPAENLSLDATLNYLNTNTPLVFTKINSRYITVVLKTDETTRCGKIHDISNGSSLEGATIQANNGKYATISDAKGMFYIPDTIEVETLTISYVGYETISFSAKKLTSTCTTILLIPSVTELNYITLNTLFTKGIEKELDGSININTDNFGLLPGQIENDVLQISQVLPGVESVDETISNINIRGGTQDENLILWDDIKMYQNGHFFGLISAFNPDLTKKVTIYKNGTPAQYGESVSGVIAMQSKNTVSDIFSGGVGFNLINGSAFIDVPVSEKLSIQVSGRRSINNVLETPVYKTYSERIFQDSEITNVVNNSSGATVIANEDFSFFDFSTKLLWDISKKDKVRLNFLTIDNQLDFTENLEGSPQSTTSKLGQQSSVGGVSWNRTWNNSLETTALAYGSFYLLDGLNKDVFTTQEQLQENEVLETGVKLKANFKLSEKNTIQGGYHFSETGIANTQDVNLPRFRSYEKNVLRTHAVFGNLKYAPNGKQTIINSGLRVNYFDKFSKFIFEPRLSLHQKLGSGFALEALGEFKSQTTTQRIDFESDFLGVEKRRWILTNDKDIPVIESKQVSLGFVYNKNKWFVNAEGFYKQVSGITTTNQGFQNQFQFVRATGSYTVSGAEFVLNKKFKSFSTWFSYLYLKNDFEFKELIPSSFPNNLDIRHSATIAGSYSFKDLKIALGFNWHSGKPYTIPLIGDEIVIIDNLQTIQYDRPNAERLPDYFRADLSVEYLWKISSGIDAKINVAIINLLNTKNTLNVKYAVDTNDTGETRINQIEEISLGLTPNFSLQMLF